MFSAQLPVTEINPAHHSRLKLRWRRGARFITPTLAGSRTRIESRVRGVVPIHRGGSLRFGGRAQRVPGAGPVRVSAARLTGSTARRLTKTSMVTDAEAARYRDVGWNQSGA